MTLSIRPTTADDFPRIVSIINSQETEGTTLEGMLRSEQLRPADMPHFRLGAFDETGELVAFGTSWRSPQMPTGCFGLRVRVDQPYRHRGAGRALYNVLEDWVMNQGATRLETEVKDNQPEAMAWADRRGWVKEHHLFESTLQLTDWAPADWQHEAVRQAEAAGIRFAHLSELVSGDELYRRYYDLISLMMRDVPAFGDRPLPPFEMWKKYLTADPHFDPANVIIAVDGDTWAAMADLQVMQSTGGMYHGLTAVDRPYRGRGLSTAIKVVALQHAKAKGAPYVRTNNHSANAPMLAVNRKFGYVPAPGFFTIAKTLPKLD
ncbi:MAG: GCN5-related N-acetyltransferase [Symbiobacteriaceae bacterium]|jgi:GNAT superfamily N-acetyltransferase|nr:GCN5-related N-acetyltransferase [Symbiobacteriaceae bacterium]